MSSSQIILLNRKLLFFFFLFWLSHVACRVLVPQSETEPRPWQWKCWVLTAEQAKEFPTEERHNCPLDPESVSWLRITKVLREPSRFQSQTDHALDPGSAASQLCGFDWASVSSSAEWGWHTLPQCCNGLGKSANLVPGTQETLRKPSLLVGVLLYKP